MKHTSLKFIPQTSQVKISAITILALIGILFNQVAPAAAQNGSGLTMKVEAAFGGNFKYGEWLPLWVEIENNGPDLQAEVQVRVSGSGGTMVFKYPIDLPTISHKRLPVFVLPNNFTRQLDVRLMTRSAPDVSPELIDSKKVSVKPNPTINYLIGLIAPERGALALLNAMDLPGNVERPKVIVDVRLADLPERFEGLRSFDLLVLNDTDTSSLTPEQQSALSNWISQGGRLVIGGGANVQQTISGLPKQILPFKPDTTLPIVSVAALSGFQSNADPEQAPVEIRVPGPFVVASGQPINNGKVLLSQENLPLLVEMAYGSGLVDFISLDLSITPFDAWSGTTGFWETLVGPGALYPEWMAPDVSIRQQIAGQMPYSLSNLPILDLPSAGGLALLLGLYILLVGPINYLLLRWKKSLHLAWVTIPVITIIFSIGAFSLGYALHGTDVFLNKISIIELHPDGQASVSSYIGLFSPGQSAYEVEIMGGGLISPLSPYYNPWDSFGDQSIANSQEIEMVQGNPGYVRGLSVEQWSMQSFMIEGLVTDFGKLTIDLHLRNNAGGAVLEGTLRNESHQTIQDAVIVWAKQFHKLGEIVPGQEIEISMPISEADMLLVNNSISYRIFEDQLNTTTGASQRQAEVRRSIIEGLIERTAPIKIFAAARAAGKKITDVSGSAATSIQNPLLIGWIDQAPPEAQISGATPAQQTTAALLYPVNYTIDPGYIVIPTGLIPGQITHTPADGGICGDTSSTSIYLGRQEAIFEFTLPEWMESSQVENLKLSIYNDSGWQAAPTVSLFNWPSQEWNELSGLQQGINLIPDATKLIDANGIVRLRIINEKGSSGCFYLGMGLEGIAK